MFWSIADEITPKIVTKKAIGCCVSKAKPAFGFATFPLF